MSTAGKTTAAGTPKKKKTAAAGLEQTAVQKPAAAPKKQKLAKAVAAEPEAAAKPRAKKVKPAPAPEPEPEEPVSESVDGLVPEAEAPEAEEEAKARKAHRYRAGTRAVLEALKERKLTTPVLKKAPTDRFVRATLAELGTGYHPAASIVPRMRQVFENVIVAHMAGQEVLARAKGEMTATTQNAKQLMLLHKLFHPQPIV
jgi:hypothetical protein